MHYAAHCTLATHLSCCKKWLNGLLWVVCTQHIHSNANPVHFFFSFLLLFVYSFVPISFCLDLVPLWYDTSNSRQHSVVVVFLWDCYDTMPLCIRFVDLLLVRCELKYQSIYLWFFFLLEKTCDKFKGSIFIKLKYSHYYRNTTSLRGKLSV